MVTHDNRILDVADRIVNMVDGRVISDVVVREAAMIGEFMQEIADLPRADAGHAGLESPTRCRAEQLSAGGVVLSRATLATSST